MTYGAGHSCISNRMIILQVFWVKRNCCSRFRYRKKTVVIVNVVFVQQLSCLLKRSVRPYKFVKCTFVSRKININPPADRRSTYTYAQICVFITKIYLSWFRLSVYSKMTKLCSIRPFVYMNMLMCFYALNLSYHISCTIYRQLKLFRKLSYKSSPEA